MRHFKYDIYQSYTSAMLALEKAISAGWVIDNDAPPEQVGFAYALSLVRDDEPPVVLTRAEIMAKARAAKIAKKQGGEGE